MTMKTASAQVRSRSLKACAASLDQRADEIFAGGGKRVRPSHGDTSTKSRKKPTPSYAYTPASSIRRSDTAQNGYRP
jgi:hypothetical protein